MIPQMSLVLSLVFIAVALLTGAIAWFVLAEGSPERKRLQHVAQAAGAAGGVAVDVGPVLDTAAAQRVEGMARLVPTSPAKLGQTRKRLLRAGYRSINAAIVFSALELVLPIVFGGVVLLLLGVHNNLGLLLAVTAAALGYMTPGIVLERLTTRRKKRITNGLPDALDLLIVCLEAGSGLDQAIVKTTEELALAHPELAEELKLVTIETRAGKPRLEAFRNLAQRTGVDEIKSLVTMLVQTDRFGTSVAQALRVHADTSRTKRRQRAEERAAKLGVKLVFPLVFCLFPAFYVVALGPAVIQFIRFFSESGY